MCVEVASYLHNHQGDKWHYKNKTKKSIKAGTKQLMNVSE